ncbi:MAG: 50S ribosomal protein L39e [Deltaproteobacteria bacterium]|nr:50S ribosomal protein L39e [Deltaproteobacteria bacterium]
MARNKFYPRKKRYAKALKTNKPVPTWITMRTNRNVRQHPGERNWRSHTIKR